MNFLNKICILYGAFIFAGSTHAGIITTYYGDDDGFGVGTSSGTINATISNQEFDEAAFTDMRLISGPIAFKPTDNFDAFIIDGTITDAVLTLRTGSFDSSPALNFPNRIFLDGFLVDTSFIDSFSILNTDLVETRSLSLDSSFFPLLMDGLVSLNGTVISEALGSGSFQVDFLSLQITTDSVFVSEPSSIALIGLGVIGLGLTRRKRSNA